MKTTNRNRILALAALALATVSCKATEHVIVADLAGEAGGSVEIHWTQPTGQTLPPVEARSPLSSGLEIKALKVLVFEDINGDWDAQEDEVRASAFGRVAYTGNWLKTGAMTIPTSGPLLCKAQVETTAGVTQKVWVVR